MSVKYQIKTDKNGENFISITGYEGEVFSLIIPENIENHPVKEIGASAFSGRLDIREVHLPKTIEILGRYAFYNCINLRKLYLCDGVEDYYDGVIKQCRGLEEIDITFFDNNYSVMRDLLRDNDRKLRFGLHLMDGQCYYLTFPAYVYDFVEDVEARVLHHKIEGAGYPYRECVTRRNIDFLNYDRLFENVMSDNSYTAAELALDRLMYPYNLNADRKELYVRYVLNYSKEILNYLLVDNYVTGQDTYQNVVTRNGKKNDEIINYMCENNLITKEAVEEGIREASQSGKTSICAILMNYQRDNFGNLLKNTSNDLSLEDW